MPSPTDLVLVSATNGVATITMNNPAKLNGWTMTMMDELKAAFKAAAADDDISVVILTGTGPYYCAGVNLGATLKPAHPKQLRAMIVEHNRALFDAFLEFPKPIIAAVNGPAIGASVTSATLCDALIASERATFSTPFHALGVPPEGCSSVLFPALMGPDIAPRMLGREGYKPDGTSASQIKLADRCVQHGKLLSTAQELAEQWIVDGRTRGFRGGFSRDELMTVNARESEAVADAFLAVPFLKAQYRFLRSKGKHGPAMMFFTLWQTRPVWARML